MAYPQDHGGPVLHAVLAQQREYRGDVLQGGGMDANHFQEDEEIVNKSTEGLLWIGRPVSVSIGL